MPEIKIQDFFSSSKAFFVAVSRYNSSSIPNLSSPEGDVSMLSEIINKKHGFELPKPDADGNSTFGNPSINPDKAQLTAFISGIRVNENDRVILYFAGHGIAIDSKGTPKGYLLATDADPSDPASFVAMDEVLKALTKLKCKHLLLVLDCCFAGAFEWGYKAEVPEAGTSKIIYYEKFRHYANHKAWRVLTSAACNQKSAGILRLGQRERKDGDKTSPFASLFASAINGGADLSYGGANPEGIITSTELAYFLQQKIFNDARQAGTNLRYVQAPKLVHLFEHDHKLNSRGEFIIINPAVVQQKNIVELPDIARTNPYKGLDAYTADDSHNFYGRQRVLEGWERQAGLIKTFEKSNLLIVSGAAGTGKSSLIKAGLIPAINKTYPVKELRPGRSPFSTYVNLLNVLKQATERHVVFVDQYEELFTLAGADPERSRFELMLGELAAVHKIVIAVRSDFEYHFKDSSLFNGNAGNPLPAITRFTVPVFLRDEIEEIVRRPASQQLLYFQSINNTEQGNEAFIERMVDDAFRHPSPLPLLSLCLYELYERQDHRNLLETTYHSFNGIEGILDWKAVPKYEKYTPESGNRELFQWLLFRMISMQGGTISTRRIYTNLYGQPAAKKVYDELVYWYDQTTVNIKQVAASLVKEKLLVYGTDETGKTFIEPAHETLFTSLGLMQDWLKEKDERAISELGNVLLHLAVSSSSFFYFLERSGRKRRKFLWKKDPRLDDARVTLRPRLNVYEEVFLNDSYRLRERGRRLKRAAAVVFVLAVMAVAALFYYRANQSIERAKEMQSLSLVALTDASELTDGLNMLKYAYEHDSTSPGVIAKIISFSEHDRPVNGFIRKKTDIPQLSTQLEYINDSLYFFNGAGGNVTIHSASGDKVVNIAESELYPRMLRVPGQRSFVAYVHGSPLKTVSFNGAVTDTIFTGVEDRFDRLQFQWAWDRLLVLLPRFLIARQYGMNDTIKPRPGSGFTSFCPSAVKDQVYIGCSDGSIFLYNLALRKLSFIRAGDRPVKSLSLLPRGKICLLDTDSLVSIYDDGDFIKLNSLKGKKVYNVRPFKTSARLLLQTASQSDSLVLWNYENGSKILLQQVSLRDRAGLSSSERLIITSTGNVVSLWNTRGEKTFNYVTEEGYDISDAMFGSADKDFIAVSFPAKKMINWKLDSSGLYEMRLPAGYNDDVRQAGMRFVKPWEPANSVMMQRAAERVQNLYAALPGISFSTGYSLSGKRICLYGRDRIFVEKDGIVDSFMYKLPAGENLALVDFTLREDSLIVFTNRGRVSMMAVNKMDTLKDIINLKTRSIAAFSPFNNTVCLQDSATGKLSLFKTNGASYFSELIPATNWTTDKLFSKICYIQAGMLHVLDVASKQESLSKINEAAPHHLVLSPDGNNVAFAGALTDRTALLKLYTLQSGKIERLVNTYNLEGTNSAVVSLKFSSDENYLVVTFANGLVKNYLTAKGAGKWIREVKAAPLRDGLKKKYNLE